MNATTVKTAAKQPVLEWGEAIAYLLDERGYTIKELRIASGVNEDSTVRRWRQEGTSPTLATARTMLFNLAGSGHRADAELLAQSMLLGTGLQIATPPAGAADFDGDGDVDTDDAIGHLLSVMERGTKLIRLVHQQPSGPHRHDNACESIRIVRELVSAAGNAAVALHDIAEQDAQPISPARPHLNGTVRHG